MVRRSLPCPLGSSSGELLGVGRKAALSAPRLLAISLLHGEVALFFDLGGP